MEIISIITMLKYYTDYNEYQRINHANIILRIYEYPNSITIITIIISTIVIIVVV